MNVSSILSLLHTCQQSMQTSFRTITTITTNHSQVSTPSTTPTLVLLVFIPKRFAGAWNQSTEVHYLQCPGSGEEGHHPSRLGGRRPTQGPGHSLSPRPPGASREGAGASGPAQTSGNPAFPGVRRSPRPRRALGTPADQHTPSARERGHRGDPRATPDVPARAGAGPPHGHSPAAAAPRPPLPPPCPHASRQLPRGSGPGAASPPDPPPWVRAAPGPGPVRGGAAAAAAAAPFPPSSFNASLPPRPASCFLDPVSARAWQANLRLQGSHRAPSFARHKDGAAGGLPMAISRGFPHNHGRAGTHRKGGQWG